MELILTQRTKTFITLAIGIPVSILLLWGFLKVLSQPYQMISFGETSVDTALVSFVIVKFLWFISYVWFVVVGFKTSTSWGIFNLLIPLAVVFFTIIHFQKAKKPAAVYLSGLTLLLLTLIWTKIR